MLTHVKPMYSVFVQHQAGMDLKITRMETDSLYEVGRLLYRLACDSTITRSLVKVAIEEWLPVEIEDLMEFAMNQVQEQIFDTQVAMAEGEWEDDLFPLEM